MMQTYFMPLAVHTGYEKLVDCAVFRESDFDSSGLQAWVWQGSCVRWSITKSGQDTETELMAA
jgi:hypothetical protein